MILLLCSFDCVGCAAAIASVVAGGMAAAEEGEGGHTEVSVVKCRPK